MGLNYFNFRERGGGDIDICRDMNLRRCTKWKLLFFSLSADTIIIMIFSWRTCLKQMSILDPVANVYASNNLQNFDRLNSFFAELRAFFIAENLQFNPGTMDTLRRAEIKVGVPTRILDDTEIAQIFNSIRIIEDSYEQRKTVNLIPWQSTEDSDYFAKLLEAMKLQRNSELRKIGTFIQSGDSVNWPSLEPRFIYNSLGNELGKA